MQHRQHTGDRAKRLMDQTCGRLPLKPIAADAVAAQPGAQPATRRGGR